MDLSNLKVFKGSKKKKKRVGRGQASGLGKTAGRGNKGAQSRSGGGVRPGFEGGQMPLYRRVPKLKGFKALEKKDYVIINLTLIETLGEEIVNIDILKKHKLLSKNETKIKVLANGKITKKVKVEAHMFSKKAIELITKAGGQAEVMNG